MQEIKFDENGLDRIDFDENGLVPAIVQQFDTGEVLMLGYMNEDSLNVTKEKGHVTFWSRNRKELWTKGETSGNLLILKSIDIDCDGDTLLVKADIGSGVCCHRGTRTCFD
ncbi:MAG: phosphoribosyl-AMP cyclohydrolase [Bifidobacteriaceae bacterium]|jgi:phosphoribosyl-AMP cyclohydrolase|nr:phosphoribosyl-AMP cyclohydrolase [Bifidobacteriaceae bacterium]